jgi:hypothetical protein
MASLADIVFDCTRPSVLARFWADALEDYRVAPYDDGELARLRSMGITDVDDDPTVLVEPTAGVGVRLWFQSVPEPKRSKNRVHIDLQTDDFELEIARLLRLGAHELDAQPNPDLVVLVDPEGNEFCLLRPRAGVGGRRGTPAPCLRS